MSIAEAALYATLALVCAGASGWLLCQFWHGWTGGQEDEPDPQIGRLIDGYLSAHQRARRHPRRPWDGWGRW